MSQLTNPDGPLRPGALASLLVAGALGFASTATLPPGTVGAPPQDQAEIAERVEAVRAALEERAEAVRLVSKLENDWKVGRELLTDRIELVQQEIDALREGIARAEESRTETQRKVLEAQEENERLKVAAASLDGVVVELEARLLALLGRMPEPVVERVKPLSQSIPAPGSETNLRLTDRFANLVTVINEIDKFNRDVTVMSEVRELPDGANVSVETLYVGIGQGYYVSKDGSVAGIGTATEDGWVWIPSNDQAEVIARAIAVRKNAEPAAFVPLPVRVQ